MGLNLYFSVLEGIIIKKLRKKIVMKAFYGVFIDKLNSVTSIIEGNSVQEIKDEFLSILKETEGVVEIYRAEDNLCIKKILVNNLKSYPELMG